MSDLIRRSDALAAGGTCGALGGHLIPISAIAAIPAVDAVEVVWCKECKHHYWEQEPCHGRTEHFCRKLGAEVRSDFFCAAGRKKEADAERRAGG